MFMHGKCTIKDLIMQYECMHECTSYSLTTPMLKLKLSPCQKLNCMQIEI